MDEAARQVLRALRGRRSQVALSRWLGYRGNVVAKWEGGQRFPTFGETLRACGRVGIDVPAALRRFHAPSAGAWDPADAQDIAAWLRALQGQTSQAHLAERAGLSRQQVGRMLSGRTRGRLPEVLALVDALTGRLPDLIGALVPIDQVPALAEQARVRRALARLAFAHPWASAVGPWLETKGEVRAADAPAVLARDLGVDEGLAVTLIDALIEGGLVQVVRGRLRPAPPASVEIAATDEDVQRLRVHWASVSAERMARGPRDDLFSFNVFAVSRADLAKIRELQRRFYREVRAIVADSPPEALAMLVVHTAGLVDGA